MRLLLDLEKLKDPYSGLGQFCTHLTNALVAQLPAGDTAAALVRRAELGYLGEGLDYRRIRFYDRFFAMRSKVDVWHNLHQESPYWPRSRRIETVLTIHDLNFLYREDYSLIKKARKLKAHQRRVDRADVIVTVSEYSASEVRQHLDVRDKRLAVVYNGCPPILAADQGEAVAGVEGPFVLGIGVMHPRKNWAALLPLLARLPDLRLVLAGHDGGEYGEHVRDEVARLELADRVTITGPITETQKTWLMHGCEALWFPSLSEGFGMPAVEAMSVGKPVFLSARTSLPEIGGDLAYYWDSFAPEAMAEVYRRGMREFAADPGRAAALRARAATFTWERAAAAYLEIYRSLLDGE